MLGIGKKGLINIRGMTLESKIQMVDLHTQYLNIKSEIDEAIQSVLDSTAFIKGPQVSLFEQELSKFHDGAFVITCANGTDALQIAMMALGFKPGDELMVPVFTYVATAEVIALLGLKPVFVDVNPDTFNINVEELERRLTPKTVAIAPVHLYGQCADMEPILAFARRHGLKVIEDYAQAFGAQYRFSSGSTKKAGTMGDFGCTSFFPSKNLGCYGDGGALVTTNHELAEKARMIANHGQRVKYFHDEVGVNSRLDTLQAAILSVKLKYIKQYETSRNSVAGFYDKALAGIDQVQIPTRAHNSTHVFHQYTVKLSGWERDRLKKHLESLNVPSMVYYPLPLHLQKAFVRPAIGEGDFPISEALCKQVISLPIHTEMPESQLSYICGSINSFRN